MNFVTARQTGDNLNPGFANVAASQVFVIAIAINERMKVILIRDNELFRQFVAISSLEGASLPP